MPFQYTYGSMGRPMSSSWGSGVTEAEQLFPGGGRPTPGARRCGQFIVNGMQNRTNGSVRAYSTEAAAIGSGRPYDEFPPSWLASTWAPHSSSSPRPKPTSTPRLMMETGRPPTLGGSVSTLGGSVGFGQLSRPSFGQHTSSLSPTGRHKVLPNMGDSIFNDWPAPAPPAPGDDSRAIFKRYRNAQLQQVNAFQRGKF